MRFFHRNKDESRPIDAARQQRSPYKVSMTGSDYSDMRQNTVTLKVWLPESVEKQLDELTSYLNTSLSDFIRQILFQHLYGRYDLIGLVERQKFDPEEPFQGVKYSISPLPEEIQIPVSPSKKVAGVKVYVPERMRKDLDSLAGTRHQTISEYVRAVILNHLFGVMHSSSFSSVPHDAEEGVE